MKILVDASYINNSGGKVLLESFIKKIIQLKIANDFYFILDMRLRTDYIKYLSEDKVEFINSSAFNRTKIFFRITEKFKFNSVLCLNNLPPPFFFNTFQIKVYIYFHNMFYLNFDTLSIFQRFSFIIKRFYIKFFNKKSYHWIVQNKSTKEALNNFLRNNKIFIFPFFPEKILCNNEVKVFDYIYVANNSPQKNLNLLLDVWEELASENYFPSLILTIDKNKNKKLLKRVLFLTNKGIKIINLGLLSHNDIISYYSKSKALIFPSKFESFGLPLIEAAQINMPIIASDKPYLHDIIETKYLFDPNSKTSILESVKFTFFSIDNLVCAKLKCDNKINNLINLLYV